MAWPALGLFWALSAHHRGVTLRVMDPSTSIEVPTGPIEEDGAWRLEPVEAACRRALEAHGLDPWPPPRSTTAQVSTSPTRPGPTAPDRLARRRIGAA